MKSKEIHNLFGEPLSDEIERRVTKNKTLAFQKKSKATKEYHYIPIKNIKHRKETKQFLNEILGLLTAGWRIDQIVYALGLELTAEQQQIMEQYVDEMKYDEIEKMLSEIFRL